MLFRRLLTAAFLFSAFTVPTFAQQVRCFTSSDPRCDESGACANTFYNPDVTANFERTAASADRETMSRVAGVYYSEVSNQQVQMVNRAYRNYGADGQWGYQDQTCSSTGCSQNQGVGQWVGYPQPDGSIFLMVHFSDLSRTDNCFSQTIVADQGGFTDALGAHWQRVQ